MYYSCNENFMQSFGKRVEESRNALHLSQEQLAERMGYKHKTSISCIELGKNDVPVSKIIALSEALNVSIAYLMGWEEQLTQEEQNFLDLFRNATADGRYEAYYALKSNQKRTADQESLSNLA